MDRARGHGGRTAVLSEGEPFTYNDLLRHSELVAAALLLTRQGGNREGVRISGRHASPS